jgi:large repetitive protein
VDVQDSQCLVPTGVALLVFPEPVELDSVVWTHLATGNTTFEGGLFEATFGDYSVTIWDGNGCTATQEFTIGADIVIYNGVSANGDGLNDFFIMDCIDQFPNNNVKIFNRAGAIVWENDGYDNTDVYFDGVSNKGIVAGSRVLPAGTYFYLVDKGDGTDPLSGYLELIR